ncbi:LacI family DNA-binding transcriptional regulator [Macrococcus animalis]|uniref:LacI family DNA-binding transcriptional regulator n=1 Tax=Macrococcus animalis TaxID=3395467 RepID=UPI0039BDD246
MLSSKEIAKLAGVSQSTVSRVINNPSAVRKDKREKVEQVMKEHNYIPNSIARSLISNKTNQISLISGTLNNPFFIESTRSIINYANKHGYNVNVFFEEELTRESLYENVLSQKTDGIILSSMYYESDYLDLLESINIPYVMYNRRHRNGGNFVELNNLEAGQLATNYLLDKGYKDILWIGGEQEKSTFRFRLQGFLDVCSERKVSVDTENVLNVRQQPEVIKVTVQQFITSGKLPDAILAATDMIAINVLDELIKNKINVPRDIALIGIDNTEMIQHRSFDITSIGVESGKSLAETAIVELINAIENKQKVNCQITMKSFLYERGTT